MSMPTSMKIGNLLVETPVALGPMAGVTDSAYREIAASMGCGLFTTEMVSAKALYYRNKNTELLLKRGKTEYPLGVQLFGNDPDIIAEMALSVERAKEVAAQLCKRGIAADKFICRGSGSKYPVADNSTKEGMAQNRRVEITILE